MRVTRTLIVIATIGLLATNTFFSRALTQNQKPDQEQIVKLKSELISIRAVVTDKSGKVIEGLKKQDFELLESNHPQEISFFSLEKITGNAKESASLKLPDNEKERVNKTLSPSLSSSSAIARTVVLFVDRFHMAQPNLVKLKETLKQFIDEKLIYQLPGDW